MFSGRMLLLYFLAFLSFLSLWLIFSDNQQHSLAIERTPTQEIAYFPPTPDLCTDDVALNASRICATFPHHLLSDIQITIKTGIGERGHLKTLLRTFTSCIPSILIVSDAPDTVQGHPVHDILADLPANYTRDPDWTAYEEQHRALAAGELIEKNHGGWKLDRFKFLPMVEYAYGQRPEAKWFVFLETDVYMFWDTLFRLLERLDPDERHYLGAAAVGAYDRWFAYGGAGFVLSRGMLGDLTLSGEERLSAKYEGMVRRDCCGDAVLAYVLYAELGARIGNMFPTFSGQEPQWAWVQQGNWCVPLLSLHRVTGEQMESLWRWERCRAFTEQPITFATLMDWSLSPVLAGETMRRFSWDNGADTEELFAQGRSAATCFAACERAWSCLQASYAEEKCRFADTVRPGQSVRREVVSFWDLKKLEKLGWRPEDGVNNAICDHGEWLEPDTILPPKDWLQVLHLKAWPEPVPETALK